MAREIYGGYATELEQMQRQVFRLDAGSYENFSRNGQAEDLKTIWHEFSTRTNRKENKKNLEAFAGSVME